jgi:hypothetical protein
MASRLSLYWEHTHHVLLALPTRLDRFESLHLFSQFSALRSTSKDSSPDTPRHALMGWYIFGVGLLLPIVYAAIVRQRRRSVVLFFHQ